MTHVLGELLAGGIRYSLFLLEAALAGFAVWLALRRPAFARARLRRAEKFLKGVARRRRLTVLCIGLTALAGRAILTPVLPVREPEITDEFSYLLSAGTFAAGRLANPPHPMWRHFETMHVNQRPAYMSMYPPAQGLVLAAGKAAADRPWLGVWVSAAVMCASLCWMLQGWLPPYWALLGGLLAVMRLGLFGYWVNSYWGGAVAATGGALVLGALPRILRKWRARDALILASGAAVLAFSRPYEGLLLTAPVFLILAVQLIRRRRALTGASLLRFAAPIVIVLGAAGAAQGYYNWRLTGDAWLMPYELNRQTYVMAPYFLWEPVNTRPVFQHESMRKFYVGWQLRHSLAATASAAGFVLNAAGAAGVFWMFYLGPALTLPLVMFPRVVRDRRLQLLVANGAIVIIGIGLVVFFYPHYAAPLTAALYAVLLQGMRHMRFSTPGGRSSGLLLTAGLPIVCLAVVLVRIPMQASPRFLPLDHPATWCHTRPGNVERARILSFLESQPGPHLVLVRYRSDHNVFEEWVYNEPDIDGARVVWAREMDEAANADLFHYFRGRRVWVVEADRKPPRLAPYPWTSAPPATP